MKLTESEKELWYKYKIPGNTDINRRKVNALHISAANSKEHEMAKCEKAYDLIKEGHKILTEAQECSKRGLRHDLIDLTADEIYEFETDPKRAIRFKDMKINVIMVKKND